MQRGAQGAIWNAIQFLNSEWKALQMAYPVDLGKRLEIWRGLNAAVIHELRKQGVQFKEGADEQT